MGNRNNLAMLAVLYGSAFVAAFNENTVNVALISIMGEFAVDANTAQWLVTGYMIVTAIVVTVSAFLTKRLRLRTLFLTAAGFLTLGLVAAMLAPTWPLFLAARLVQAVGTGIFIPVMMSTVLAVAPRTRMGTYLSIDGCMITFGPAFAPVVSGLMVTTLGWRSIFLPPAALIVVLAFLGVALIRNIAEPEKIKLDGISVVLSAVDLLRLRPLAGDGVAYGGGHHHCRRARGHGRLRRATASHSQPAAEPDADAQPAVRASVRAGSRRHDDDVFHERASAAVLRGCPRHHSAGGRRASAGAHPGERRHVPGGRPCHGQAGQLAFVARRVRYHHRGAAGGVPLRPTLSLAGVLVASVVVYAGVGLVLSPSQTAGLQTLSPEQNPHGVAILNTFIQIAAAVGPSLFIGVLSSVAGSVEAAGTAAALAQAEGFSVAVAAACAIAAAGTLTALALCPQAPTSRRGANDWRADGGSSGRWWHCRRDGYLRQHDAHPRPCGHSSTSPDLRFGI